MYQPPDPTLWTGRVDDEEGNNALRWHQVIQPLDLTHSTLDNTNLDNRLEDSLEYGLALLGFACDEGVKRNKGRPGARNGPTAIRKALTNLAVHKEKRLYDAGDISANDETSLEEAQLQLAQHITELLNQNRTTIVLGGGHEMAWGSYLGLANYIASLNEQRTIGIINFDAHLDLRNPLPRGTSGTPFRQIANHCQEQQQPFNYLALGINESANTAALFDFAAHQGAYWRYDVDCNLAQLKEMENELSMFIRQIDELYLTICMDVFPVTSAPGVSAPAALGVDPIVVFKLISMIKALCQKHGVVRRISDIAETNPEFDHHDNTSKLAARLIHELV